MPSAKKPNSDKSWFAGLFAMKKSSSADAASADPSFPGGRAPTAQRRRHIRKHCFVIRSEDKRDGAAERQEMLGRPSDGQAAPGLSEALRDAGRESGRPDRPERAVGESESDGREGSAEDSSPPVGSAKGRSPGGENLPARAPAETSSAKADQADRPKRAG